ncbi:unnamed protein product, partial [Staurois parvus]
MTQGPHDPLLPGGPMSCQSAPGLLSKTLQQYPVIWQPKVTGTTTGTCTT